MGFNDESFMYQKYRKKYKYTILRACFIEEIEFTLHKRLREKTEVTFEVSYLLSTFLH